MKNLDLSKILTGAVTVVVGVLIAVLGIGSVMDTYLAVLSLIAGSFLVLFTCLMLFYKKPLPLISLILGGVFIAIGVGVFTKYITFAMLINIIIISLFGVGSALAIYGIYAIFKINVPFGIGFVVIGGGIVALAACYVSFENFQKVFWIITGILIAVSGGLDILYAVIEKK